MRQNLFAMMLLALGGCGGAEVQAPQSHVASEFPPDKVTANWVLTVEGQPVRNQLIGPLGAEIKVTGQFNVLVRDGYEPGQPVLEIVEPRPNGELVAVQAAACTVPKNDGRGNYSFETKIKVPEKPGRYTLRVIFQGMPAWVHAIEVR